MSLSNVVFVCVTVDHTIPWINHLFQNGRLSLTHIVLLSPTSGNPDVFDLNTQPSAIYVVVPVRTNISRRVFLWFPTPVSLLKRRSSHSVAVISRLLFRFIVRFVSCLLCCCRVVLQPQFHSSFLYCFTKVRQVFETSISSFALCCECCVVVEFHSSHSYAASPTG